MFAPQVSNAIAELYTNISGHSKMIACRLLPMCWQLPTHHSERSKVDRELKETAEDPDLPASLQRRDKEPSKQVQFRIPLSWWDELSALGREFDQDVSTFLREATEDWLKRARRVKR